MKIELLLIGKTDNPHFAAGIEDYTQRIGHHIPFTITVIPDLKNTRNLSEDQQKMQEGLLILKRLNPTDFVVLLDERGQQPRSCELAVWIAKKQQTVRKLIFVVGGPYGFSQEVYQRANDRLSLSRLTFSHQMVRLIFVEQLYRACTIIKGEPYHHE